jgi:hypothetical protein
MSITFWIGFLFASPPAHDACIARGTPLLEMRERSELAKPTITTKLFSTGAWTVESQGRTESGCFDRNELREIRRAVQQAPWQVESSPIACFAYDPNFTEYLLHGRPRFTEQMCSGKTADTVTRRAIDLVKQELAEERGANEPSTPPPPPPPVKPPVTACRATGTPLFEIRKRSELAEPASTTAIYSTGAWTIQPTDKDGRLGARTTGCLDNRTLESLRHVINDSPWDTTFSRVVCRAYSPSFTEYYVHGELEYTARLCGPQRLDEKSLGAITIIEDELSKKLPVVR